MAILLPLLAAALLFAIRLRRRADPREALVASALLWSLLLLLAVEGLSLFHALTPAGLAAFWCAVSLPAAAQLWRLRHAQPQPTNLPAPPTRPDRLLIASLSLLAAILLVAALTAPPNTWDVMAYHMPRVMAWIQDRSVAFFPTHLSRQVESPPFAEYVATQSELLFGSDRLANVGQWFALVGSALTASLVARRLSAGARGQLFAAVACATIPPAILEATGAKNDNIVAFWTLCATLKLLELSAAPADRPGLLWRRALEAGAAIGLAMLTKGTFYFFGWPVVALLSVAALRKHRWRALPPLATTATVALTLNAAYFARNLHYFHDLFGSPVTHNSIENTHYTARTTASNVVGNLAAQCATPSEWFNQHILYEPAARLYHWINAAPPTTAPDATPFFIRWGQFHDDNSGGGAHVPLILLCLGTFIVTSRRRHPLAAALVAALAISFLTFCTLTIWQAWHGRYLIVLFTLCAPIVGLSLEAAPRRLGYAVALLLLLLAIPYALLNQTRPLVGPRNIFTTPRIEQYFASRQPSILPPFRDAARLIAAHNPTEVGLLSDYNSWPYALRKVLDESLGHPVRLDYLNGFFRYPPEAFKVRVPDRERGAGDVLVVLPWWNWGAFQPTPKVLTEHTGAKFYVAEDFGPIAVYTRAAAADIVKKAFLERGWLDVSRTPAGHWTARAADRASVILCRPDPATLLLTGQIASDPLPALVTFKVNGTDVATLPVNTQSPHPFGPIPLPLTAGDNHLEIITHQFPVQSTATLQNHTLLLSDLTLTNPIDHHPINLLPITPPPRY